ncbi:MAG: GntR family transcriptional regulator [Phenylobacterium sp.]|uniref:GntR family transcriptional regulator n=1 Tax=Phenylobacterium sp. TaxID=1871053 RepID=UPI002735289B|nr:GntR family transcriptional regulator [Phenylobacterium sp.]MDP3175427.1 GntR family transcriptional regulator [Phenylobacterium sp.]
MRSPQSAAAAKLDTLQIRPVARGPSVNETVYEALKGRITNNQLRAGVKLTHQELAEQLNVSRTPVREALERLYQEGLVTRQPRRGFYVAEINDDDARELFELREALEVYALRLSLARGIGPADLRRLDDLNRSHRALMRTGSTRELMMANRDWHMALASLGGNRSLLNSLGAVFEKLILKIRADAGHTVRGEENLSEHIQMNEALRAGDLARAERLLAEHIQAARSRLSAHLGEGAGPAPRSER